MRDPKDSEALHDFRVGVRRLRSTLGLWRDVLEGTTDKADRRALARLQGMTGGGRDAEVALEWLADIQAQLSDVHRPGLDRIWALLEARRIAAMGKGQRKLRKRFEKLEADLLGRLRTLKQETDLLEPPAPSKFGPEAAALARKQLGQMRALLEQAHSVEDEVALHDARIAGKKLRYLLEPLRAYTKKTSKLVKKLKQLQDILGELNDAHVLNEELQRVLRMSDTPEEAKAGLQELLRLTEQRAVGLFEKLSQQRPQDMESLQAQIETLHQEVSLQEDTEIERKYLLNGLPDMPEGKRVEIRQGWLPGDRLRERLRKTVRDGATQYFRTIKLGQGVQRFELEEETTEALFEKLWPLTEGCRIQKYRYKIPLGERTLEIDEFLDRPLVMAEVELAHVDEKVEFPDWFSAKLEREVTEDGRYTNLALAEGGVPKAPKNGAEVKAPDEQRP